MTLKHDILSSQEGNEYLTHFLLSLEDGEVDALTNFTLPSQPIVQYSNSQRSETKTFAISNGYISNTICPDNNNNNNNNDNNDNNSSSNSNNDKNIIINSNNSDDNNNNNIFRNIQPNVYNDPNYIDNINGDRFVMDTDRDGHIHSLSSTKSLPAISYSQTFPQSSKISSLSDNFCHVPTEAFFEIQRQLPSSKIRLEQEFEGETNNHIKEINNLVNIDFYSDFSSHRYNLNLFQKQNLILSSSDNLRQKIGSSSNTPPKIDDCLDYESPPSPNMLDNTPSLMDLLEKMASVEKEGQTTNKNKMQDLLAQQNVSRSQLNSIISNDRVGIVTQEQGTQSYQTNTQGKSHDSLNIRIQKDNIKIEDRLRWMANCNNTINKKEREDQSLKKLAKNHVSSMSTPSIPTDIDLSNEPTSPQIFTYNGLYHRCPLSPDKNFSSSIIREIKPPQSPIENLISKFKKKDLTPPTNSSANQSPSSPIRKRSKPRQYNLIARATNQLEASNINNNNINISKTKRAVVKEGRKAYNLQKQFQCQHCERRYSSLSSLRNHSRMKHFYKN
eukprot:Awhi_evm2s10576